MKKKPLVSIIMNCYNGEKYLKDSIQSVLNQNYKNWELIFWDNQSEDRSKFFFKEFKDKRLHYYYAKKFTNLYIARNLAIKKAKGDIITFLDVDDLWLSNKLSRQVFFFKKNKKAELVYSNYFNLKNYFGFNFKNLQFKKNLPNGFITNKLLNSYCVGWPTVAIKRSVIKKRKLFNEKLDMVSDFDFIINFSLNKKIFSIQEPLAIYRQHPNQLTRKNFYIQAEQYLNWYKFLKVKIQLKKFTNFEKFFERIIFFEKIIQLKKNKASLLDIIDIFFKGKYKLASKLFFFTIFPNFFIRFIASI